MVSSRGPILPRVVCREVAPLCVLNALDNLKVSPRDGNHISQR
jgi:hypothetical protein